MEAALRIDESLYTENSLADAGYRNVKKKAQDILNDETATQEQIDQALADFVEAQKNLVLKEAEQPDTEEPGTEEPGTEEPGTEEPGTEEPGTEEPGTEESGTEEPGTGEPDTEEPETENTDPKDDEKNEVTGVSLDKSTMKLTEGESDKLTVSVEPESASNKNVSWKSSNEDVVFVSSDGLVLARKAGTATIMVTTLDGAFTASCTVTVSAKQVSDTDKSETQAPGTTNQAPNTPVVTPDKTENSTVKVTGIKISGISKKIAAGKKIRLTEEVIPANATKQSLIWSVSNEKYATVNANGEVKLLSRGKGKSVIVTATATDGSGIKATYKIKIMPKAVKKITLKAESKTVKAGKKLRIRAVVTPSVSAKKINKQLKWMSSNERCATVRKSGVVKTYKAGKGKSVKITAMVTDGSNKKKTITIRIK